MTSEQHAPTRDSYVCGANMHPAHMCAGISFHAPGVITNRADGRAQQDASPSIRCGKKPGGSPGAAAATACTTRPAQAVSPPGGAGNTRSPALQKRATGSSRAQGHSGTSTHTDKRSQHSTTLCTAGGWQEEGPECSLSEEAHAVLQQHMEAAAGAALLGRSAAAGEALCTQMLMETPMELWDFDSQRPRAPEEGTAEEPLLTQGRRSPFCSRGAHVLLGCG